MQHPIAVLNTTTVTADGTFVVETITPDEARDLLAGVEFRSYVGHPDTAALLTALLGVDIPVCRDNLHQQPGQIALVFKLNGRPFGQEMDLADLERVGYTLKTITRTA